MIPKSKSWIRRWIKRHGKAWFKHEDQMVQLNLKEFEGLSPKEASAWFDYDTNWQEIELARITRRAHNCTLKEDKNK